MVSSHGRAEPNSPEGGRGPWVGHPRPAHHRERVTPGLVHSADEHREGDTSASRSDESELTRKGLHDVLIDRDVFKWFLRSVF